MNNTQNVEGTVVVRVHTRAAPAFSASTSSATPVEQADEEVGADADAESHGCIHERYESPTTNQPVQCFPHPRAPSV